MTIRQFKLLKRRSEGLYLIIDGLKVQKEQAEWHLGWSDLSKEARLQWETRKKVVDYWLSEAESAYVGDLHY